MTDLANLSMVPAEELGYALSKQVPAMAAGFHIATGYGDIHVPAGPLAERIRGDVQRHLAQALARQEAALARQVK